MRRAGFAMPLALVVLVAASLMVATALQLSVSDFQANRAVRVAARALYVAEAGVQKTMARWESLPYQTMAPGDSISSGWVALPDGSSFQSIVLRVDDGSGPDALYRILTEGRPYRESTARRLILAMVQSGGGGATCCAAAVSVYGGLDVDSEGTGGAGGGRGRGRGRGGSASPAVDARDQVPAGWGTFCPPPGDAVTGIRIRRLADLDLAADAVVVGTPETEADGSIGTDLVRSFAGTTYSELAASADIVFTQANVTLDDVRPRSAGGACNTANDENWGAPEAPGSICWDYLPVIHASGNLTIRDEGSGQGILLVDGDLDVQDEFSFYGLVVVQGEADWDDEAVLMGALLIGNRDRLSRQSGIRGESVIRYSSCALARVLPASTSGVQLLSGRHWFEMP